MTTEATLAPFIIGLPLAGAVVLLVFGKRIGRPAGVIASLMVASAFILGVVSFFSVVSQGAQDRVSTRHLFEWMAAGSFRVGVDLLMDQLSIVMVLVVTGVGALIHIYSIGYMHGQERYGRFFSYLNLFVAFMLLLVMADNIVLLYVGWEGVGLCSYLLIGFWFERSRAAEAANKAFLVNRIGDFCFLLGILLLAATVGSVTIGDINAAAGGALPAGIATIAALLLFGGATGKSAQIPLYVWLPDAMEGPTPVSALIHAATMVTAGVYMVVRFSPLFEASGTALTVVAWVGATTALWAALMACAEYDIKRVLAYSTISQIGYMFLAAGVGGYSAALFHLVTHAFFKALMFLGAGAVMHALGGEVDMRRMGGLRKAMPVVGVSFLMGALAISGVVPFAGFFSKDAILASAWYQGDYLLWGIGVFTTLLTAFYMARLYFSVFEGELEVPEGLHAHDASPTMAAALVPLGVLSVVGGAVDLPRLVTLEHFLEPVVGESRVPTGITPWLIAGLALLIAVAGLLIGRALYTTAAGASRRARLQRSAPWFVTTVRNKFYVDRIYGRMIVLPGKALASFAAFVFDAKVIDGLVNGVAWMVGRSAAGGRHVQTGYVRNYAVIFLFGVVMLVAILFVRIGVA
jgi:NADH-quinone oxidoreductase subunit L